MKRKPHTSYKRRTQYTALHVMFASSTQPMLPERSAHQLNAMRAGLAAIESAPQPTTEHWRLCSDAVNMVETLVNTSPIIMRVSATQTDSYTVSDNSGLLMDAIAALAKAGMRHRAGGPIRLDGPGLIAVRAVIEDYAALAAQLPERAMVQAHRATETRIQDILAGRGLPHDVEVCAI